MAMHADRLNVDYNLAKQVGVPVNRIMLLKYHNKIEDFLAFMGSAIFFFLILIGPVLSILVGIIYGTINDIKLTSAISSMLGRGFFYLGLPIGIFFIIMLPIMGMFRYVLPTIIDLLLRGITFGLVDIPPIYLSFRWDSNYFLAYKLIYGRDKAIKDTGGYSMCFTTVDNPNDMWNLEVFY